ncbi:MAG: sel1 repeat family protein, partial [Nitrosomonadaceae bacterium]
QGHAVAQNNLGVMYVKGEGVTQDHVRARMWFNFAARLGKEI